MKKTIIIFTMLLSLANLIANAQDEKTVYAKKIETYKKMHNKGWVLNYFGGLALFSGIYLTSHANSNLNGYNKNQGIPGTALIIVSIPLIINGTVLTIIGDKKQKIYRDKLQKLSLKINYTPTQQGLVLSYRF